MLRENRIMETANFVTYPDMLQLLAIFSGIWFAIFSLAVSAGVAWYIRDSNRRDRDNERRDKDTNAGIRRSRMRTNAGITSC